MLSPFCGSTLDVHNVAVCFRYDERLATTCRTFWEELRVRLHSKVRNQASGCELHGRGHSEVIRRQAAMIRVTMACDGTYSHRLPPEAILSPGNSQLLVRPACVRAPNCEPPGGPHAAFSFPDPSLTTGNGRGRVVGPDWLCADHRLLSL